MRDSVDDLLGLPFAYGGRGPDSFDCYGLIRWLLKEDGIDVPDYRYKSDKIALMRAFREGLPVWRKTEIKPGGVLMFRVPGGFHVGYVMNNGRDFIHTWEASGGVCVERISAWQQRILGCYEYVGSNHLNYDQ